MERDFLGLQWKDSCHQKNKYAFNDSENQLSYWEDLARSGYNQLHQNAANSIQTASSSVPEAIKTPAAASTTFPLFNLQASNSNPIIPSPTSLLIPKKKPNKLKPLKFPFMYESVPLLGTLASPPSINSDLRPSNAGSQLTIFYANDVYVYEDVTPHQAETITKLAKTGWGKKKETAGVNEEDSLNQQCSRTSISHQTSTALYTTPTVPQARKATLEHFLQKRKDRLSKWMPYNSMQKKPSLCFNVELDLESFPIHHES